MKYYGIAPLWLMAVLAVPVSASGQKDSIDQSSYQFESYNDEKSAARIPEPITCTLIGVSGILFILRRRRK